MLDRAAGNVMFGILAAVVTIGVLNGFLMTVFERTREFGMLMAIGMRARAVIVLLQAEALMLSAIGCATRSRHRRAAGAVARSRRHSGG